MPVCVCLTGCECGLQAAFVIASQLSCGPQLVDGIQSVCPVCLSVCFPMRLTVRLTTSHSSSPSLPYFHLSFSLSVLSCSSYFICNFWKYFAYATFAGMGRRHVDYNNIRHKSGSQLTPQSVTTSPPSSPNPPSIVWKFHTHVSDNFLRHSVLFCCSLSFASHTRQLQMASIKSAQQQTQQ